MKRLYSSVEISSWLAHDEAVETATAMVKRNLKNAPLSVCQDVLARCDVEKHENLIAWLHARLNEGEPSSRRIPRAYSPKHNPRTWMLYYAADLECPKDPPTRRPIDIPIMSHVMIGAMALGGSVALGFS